MSSAGPIRFGVIGCGVIAYWSHLRELKRLPGARLVAAADPDAGARERARRLAGVPVHAEAAELLERPDIDAVVISAPTHLHAELGIAAARAGKHIYLEKPVATDGGGARRLAGAAREAGIAAAAGFNRRWHPLHRQARDLLAGGVLGSVRAVLTAFCEPASPGAMPAWKRSRSTGGGVLLDLASHHADLLRWFLGDEAVEVEARIQSEATGEDTAWMRVRMRGGVEAHGFFSFQAGRSDFLELVGERGTLRVDRHRASLSLRLARRFGYGVRSGFPFPGREVLCWRIARLVRPSYEPSYRAALADFVRAIRGGPLRGAGLEDGVRSLEIVLAAEESARAGRPVSLPRPGF
jgi:myo-inositol 2-dehydrogenase/D-chiro-inositol 1-dehydrogenase